MKRHIRDYKEDAMLRYLQSFDKKGEVMIGILSSMNETMKSVKEDTSNMLVKQDMMLEKQDDTIEEISSLRDVIWGIVNLRRGPWT